MRIIFTKQATLTAVNADGPFCRIFEPGDIVDFPADTAQVYLGNAVAKPAPAERAVKPKAEKAVRK